jgi:hypothetical protein
MIDSGRVFKAITDYELDGKSLLNKWKNMMVMLWLFSANNTSPNNY